MNSNQYEDRSTSKRGEARALGAKGSVEWDEIEVQRVINLDARAPYGA